MFPSSTQARYVHRPLGCQKELLRFARTSVLAQLVGLGPLVAVAVVVVHGFAATRRASE